MDFPNKKRKWILDLESTNFHSVWSNQIILGIFNPLFHWRLWNTSVSCLYKPWTFYSQAHFFLLRIIFSEIWRYQYRKWNWQAKFKFHLSILHSLHTLGKNMNPFLLLWLLAKQHSTLDSLGLGISQSRRTATLNLKP